MHCYLWIIKELLSYGGKGKTQVDFNSRLLSEQCVPLSAELLTTLKLSVIGTLLNLCHNFTHGIYMF